ncbi:uncharacterized protein LOC136081795 [Hydra vulgaris]|uniref:uncharacterized protein LOC136081795 n=1 Tax=Hydra vulgaris TaxID=6087 RepID=UPI0032EA7828
MSGVWKHYEKDHSENVCKICGNKTQFTGSTTGMWYHLGQKHGIKKPQHKKETSKPAAQTNPKISTFFQKESIDEVFSKLAALDGYSFNALTKSTFIWSTMTEKGYDFPKNHKQAIQLVKNYSASVKAELKNQLNSLLLTGEHFSITLDEYTSLKNRRFLNINIHQKNKHWNLGLTHVSRSFPAEKAAEVVSERVEEFGLNLADCIVCSVTDRASMMVRFGKIVSTKHQTCYTHEVHLAIQEVLYKKNQSNNLDEEKVESDNDEEEDSDLDNEKNSRFINDKINESISLPKVKVHFQSVIIKVRKIVKLFRKSPVQNDVLQEEVKKHHGREVALILDCRTRWNSLLAMFQQLLKINEQIGVVPADISPSLICTEQELDILIDIVDALEPVKLAAEALCRKNATLLTAKGIFKFLILKGNLQVSESEKNPVFASE